MRSFIFVLAALLLQATSSLALPEPDAGTVAFLVVGDWFSSISPVIGLWQSVVSAQPNALVDHLGI